MNKKVVNSQTTFIGDIRFKSLLESRIYKYLKDNKYSFKYESDKYILQKGFKSNISFYRKTSKGFTLDKSKVRDITYTPDFIIKINNYTLIIEAKGFKTDSYNIKVKLFRKLIDTMVNIVFAEITSIKELKTLLEIYEKA